MVRTPKISFLYLIIYQYTNQRGTKRNIQMLPKNKICISSASKIPEINLIEVKDSNDGYKGRVQITILQSKTSMK